MNFEIQKIQDVESPNFDKTLFFRNFQDLRIFQIWKLSSASLYTFYIIDNFSFTIMSTKSFL